MLDQGYLYDVNYKGFSKIQPVKGLNRVKLGKNGRKVISLTNFGRSKNIIYDRIFLNRFRIVITEAVRS